MSHTSDFLSKRPSLEFVTGKFAKIECGIPGNPGLRATERMGIDLVKALIDDGIKSARVDHDNSGGWAFKVTIAADDKQMLEGLGVTVFPPKPILVISGREYEGREFREALATRGYTESGNVLNASIGVLKGMVPKPDAVLICMPNLAAAGAEDQCIELAQACRALKIPVVMIDKTKARRPAEFMSLGVNVLDYDSSSVALVMKAVEEAMLRQRGAEIEFCI